MTLETKETLDQETLDGLQKLIRYNIDSSKGFKESAEEIDNASIATMFRELADQRCAIATELQQHVQWNGEEAVDDGSAIAAMHRAWLAVRGKLSGGDAYAILCEAERGEDYIKAAYESVLKSTAGSAMNSTLQHQYAKIKTGHDRVRDLRDSFKS